MIEIARDSSRDRMTGIDVAVAAQLACLLEASAPKPGNVSPGREFANLGYEDFLASAAAVGEPLAGSASRPLGQTIRRAVEATARWTQSNTNLGIVLLLAPLAKATSNIGSASSATLRDELRSVLAATTVDDARDVYAAIRRARPGGLGTVDEQDVASEPTRPLLDVMRLAAERDAIAREYATTFALTFEVGAPALEQARGDRLSWDDAVAETFLKLLAAAVDTHIARRGGRAMAADVTRQAREALAAGGVRSAAGRNAIRDMDQRLRDPRHLANPGSTADLTAAALFVVLLGGGWLQGGRDAASR